ncbi:Gamma-tubulin complex component 6 [Geranomyces variabilis]|uniref:Gamma-tubulin complex component 6 n=1 Tax=Geranomyces variabilis TaxID=109894 RepID=A0AAD5TJ50_9FUNG|nr:Gamma-tubulin complex component 6 [Geranomyces variabilis]
MSETLLALKEGREFDRCSSLETLVEDIGSYCGYSQERKPRDFVEIGSGSSARVLKWTERSSVLWLLFSLANLHSENGQRLPHHLTSVSKRALQYRRSQASRYGGDWVTDPTADEGLVMPQPHDVRITDTESSIKALRIHHPYGVVYPANFFEREPGTLGTLHQEANCLLGSDLFLKGLPRTNAFQRHSTRTLFGALTIANDVPENFWDLDIKLALPPFPDVPRSFADTFELYDPPSEIRRANAESSTEFSYDSGCEIFGDNAWTDPQNKDTIMSSLRTWEGLQSHFTLAAASPYLTESPPGVFDHVYTHHFLPAPLDNRPEQVLDEDALLQDILNVVLGISSATFNFDTPSMRFELSIKSHTRLRVRTCGSQSFARYLDRFLAIGTLMRRLDYVVEFVEGNIQLCGQTGLAFGHALASYLAFARACLAMLRDQLDGPQRRPQLSLQLARLSRAVKGSHYQLEALAEICRCNVPPDPSSPRRALFAIPLGSELLSRIYDAACVIDAALAPEPLAPSSTLPTRRPTVFIRAVLHALLEHSARPYLAWLEQWLGVRAAARVPPGALADVAGALERVTDVWDPYAEFYVAWEEAEGPAGGGGFWNGEWQMSSDVEPPSFLPRDIAQDVLHAGKCIRLLRATQPNHPLVAGAVAADFGLQWCFQPDDIDKHTAAATAYVAYFEHMIAAARRTEIAAAEEIARIREAEAQRRREEAVSVKAMKAEAAAAAQAAVQARKQRELSSVESFLKDRLAAKEAAHSAQVAADAEAERKREDEERARLRTVDEEKQKMLAAHERKMSELKKREERLDWRMMRVALNAKRKEALKTRESYERPAVPAVQGLTDGVKSPAAPLAAGPPLHDLPPSAPSSREQEGSTTLSYPQIASQERTFTSSHNTFTRPAGKSVSLNSSQLEPAPPVVSLPSLPPTFAEMQPISMLLGAPPSDFSPFFAPGIGADVGSDQPASPTTSDANSVGVPLRQKAEGQTVLADAVPSTINVVTPAESAQADLKMGTVDKLVSDNESAEIRLTHFVEPSPEFPVNLNSAPSFAQFLENHLAAAPSPSDFDAALEYMTSHTLHASLRGISALISKAAVAALRPGLRAHLAVVRRFLLFNDAAFLGRVVDALYSRQGCMGFTSVGIDVDGRAATRWPPAFGEMVEALDGVVGPTDDDWGTLEFVGGGGGRDAGAIDALASLRLRYTAPAPYDMVIGTVAVEKYGRAFGFLMLLQRARVALDRVARSEWWWRRPGGSEDDGEQFWAAWSVKDANAASRLYFEARAFVAGVTRHAFDTTSAADVWRDLDAQLADEDDGGPRALGRVHSTHDAALDALLWRLLLRPKQRPVMAIIEGMLQISVRFARRACGVDSWNGGGESGGPAGLLSAFRVRYAMLIKVLRGMVERESGVAGRDVEGFKGLLAEIDGNGFVERDVVPRLAAMQKDASSLA